MKLKIIKKQFHFNQNLYCKRGGGGTDCHLYVVIVLGSSICLEF